MTIRGMHAAASKPASQRAAAEHASGARMCPCAAQAQSLGR